MGPLRSPVAGDSSDTQLGEIVVERSGSSETIEAVLRLAPRGTAPFPDYDLGLQAHVMREIGRTGGLPVPEVLFLEEDPAPLGVPFLIMRRVDGVAPSDRPSYQGEGFYAEATTPQREHIWQGTIEAAARLHALDWRAIGGGRLPGTREGDDPRSVSLDYWQDYLAHFLKETPDESVPVFDEALAYLVAEKPTDARLSLCWGDAKLGNVLYTTDRYDLAAVIDWEMAIVGDPEQDLASLHLSDLRAQDFAGKIQPGTPSADQLVALYKAASGEPVRHFHYNLVFATFWRGAVQIAVTRQMRRQGIEIPDVMFVDNFPMNTLRRLLDLPGPGHP